jgi:hypothetical protein
MKQFQALCGTADDGDSLKWFAQIHFFIYPIYEDNEVQSAQMQIYLRRHSQNEVQFSEDLKRETLQSPQPPGNLS